MIFLNQLWSKYILLTFPQIVSCGIPFPLDEVLEITSPPKVAMIDDGLNLTFLFSINDIWGRFRKVVSVLGGFLEQCQKAGVEDVMNGPGWG